MNEVLIQTWNQHLSLYQIYVTRCMSTTVNVWRSPSLWLSKKILTTYVHGNMPGHKPLCSILYSDKVQGLCYASHTRQLISCSSDGGIVIWNMDVTRQEVRERRGGSTLMECDIHTNTHSHLICELWHWRNVSCVRCVFMPVCTCAHTVLLYRSVC